MARKLTIWDRRQVKIAKDTLKMSDVGARIMGGMTKPEARRILKKFGICKKFGFNENTGKCRKRKKRR